MGYPRVHIIGPFQNFLNMQRLTPSQQGSDKEALWEFTQINSSLPWRSKRAISERNRKCEEGFGCPEPAYSSKLQKREYKPIVLDWPLG